MNSSELAKLLERWWHAQQKVAAIHEEYSRCVAELRAAETALADEIKANYLVEEEEEPDEKPAA